MAKTVEPETLTTDEWAAEAFRMFAWRLQFLPDGAEKIKVIQFMLSAPDKVKRDAALGNIPGL